MGFSDNFFKKVEKKTKVDKDTILSLAGKLQNGNIVEILTSSNSNGPSRDWINIVKTPNAKSRIRQWFKKERREEQKQIKI